MRTPRHPLLTARDKQITDLLLQGCESKDIATELHITIRTVKAHFTNLYRQFGITDGIKRVKLAVMLYRMQHTSSQGDQ